MVVLHHQRQKRKSKTKIYPRHTITERGNRHFIYAWAQTSFKIKTRENKQSRIQLYHNVFILIGYRAQRQNLEFFPSAQTNDTHNPKETDIVSNTHAQRREYMFFRL